tara:strand:+ start:468 stop:977 length:510 start_codon:yes stop_codon:yes gene_type:complete
MPYQWFKLNSYGVLRGSIVAQLTLEEQMVWIKLLAFASEQRNRGIIQRAVGIPWGMKELADQLQIPEYLLLSTIEKCMEDENAGDPTKTRIMMLPDGSISITNWHKYQNKELKHKIFNERPEEQRKAITRYYTNKYPKEALDVIFGDYGYKVVVKSTGEVKETVNEVLE